jgi:predicted nucleic acid-binding protein
MGAGALVDTGFLVALLSARDANHAWAVDVAQRHTPPWRTCDAVLSESFHLLQPRGGPALAELLRRGALVPAYALGKDVDRPLALMEKYADVPMSFADACLVRMTEIDDELRIVTLDRDFRVYRRNGRQSVPVLMP